MPDLLLEVLSEEIPARMQAGGARELRQHVLSRLEEARLAYKEDEFFATPRRLAVLVHGLPAVQPDITVERKGPRVDAPEKAIQGFLKSTSLTLEDCEQRETPKGPVWFAVTKQKGRPTGDLLAGLLPEALAAVSWPKSMRWEESGTRWVRPIRSILCLLGDEVVPFRFGGVESGRTTLGHRFLSSGPLTIAASGDYAATLEAANVMLSSKARAQEIKDKARALAKGAGLMLVPDDWLVKENAGLVEWPVVLMGRFDESFVSLPPEVLRSAMRTHQRYFGLVEPSAVPATRFVMVANTKPADGDNAVRAGNQRVLRARLSDAHFFWQFDRRRKLEDHLPALDGVVFHARLGSMRQKAQRIAELARILSSQVKGADQYKAIRAGILCKADLVTEMVSEFPDLQGIMGHYYAEADGEEAVIALAIRDHYMPQGPSDRLPEMPESVTVALADKLDTLAGFFAIDERPTGSKDPFALRRAALGVIRLILEKRLRLPLKRAISAALANYNLNRNVPLLPEPAVEAAKDTLLAFFADRLKTVLREEGIRHDLVSAVFAASGEDDLMHLRARVDALRGFLDGEDGANLLTAYRRAANILRIEESKDGEQYENRANKKLLFEKEERTLYVRMSNASARAEILIADGNFEEAMTAMATLRAPVDAFFDNVTVNCEDPALRRNRLLMLSQIRATLDRVADFSKIEG